jgi:hypothetical protein
LLNDSRAGGAGKAILEDIRTAKALSKDLEAKMHEYLKAFVQSFSATLKVA